MVVSHRVLSTPKRWKAKGMTQSIRFNHPVLKLTKKVQGYAHKIQRILQPVVVQHIKVETIARGFRKLGTSELGNIVWSQ